MKIDVPHDLLQFVEREYATGQYPNREAVVVEAIRRLKHERDDAVAGIRAGLADAQAGRVETLDAAFVDLRNELGADGD